MDERVLIISRECALNFFSSFQIKNSNLSLRLRTEAKTETKPKTKPNLSTRSFMAS